MLFNTYEFALLILVVGMFGTRSLISTPPIIVLRGLD